MSSTNTSPITSRKISKKPLDVQKHLSIFGPLDVSCTDAFYKDCKENFMKHYNSQFPFVFPVTEFKITNYIGEGAFGSVKLSQKRGSKNYLAVKAVKKQQLVESQAISHALTEKRVLQSLNFPFGVRLIYFSQDRSFLYYFMPFVNGGEMRVHLRKLRKFNENMSCFYAAQVVLALEYFQNIRFVHRDIKPENILLDQHGFIKVVDYGFAKKVETRTYTFCGTPLYIAPEIIQGIGYAASVDWWALGILIFEMMVGKTPFRSKDNTTLFTRILYDQLPIHPGFSENLKNLLKKLLQRDVTRRFGILKNGAEDVKSHKWFKHINWLQLFNRQSKPPYVPKVGGAGDCGQFPGSNKRSSLLVNENDNFDDLFKDF